MCGNFGLLFIKNQSTDHAENNDAEKQEEVKRSKPPKKSKKKGFVAVDGEETLTRNRRVSFDGFVDEESSEVEEDDEVTISSAKDLLKNPLLILEAQAANTEIRGGQAGGYSYLEYTKVKNESPAALHPVNQEVNSPFHSTHSANSSHHSRAYQFFAAGRQRSPSNSHVSKGDTISPLHGSSTSISNNNDNTTVHNQQRPRALSQSGAVNYAPFEAEFITVPSNTRVRTVARKRYPLAADLSDHFLKARKGKTIELDKTFTGTVSYQYIYILSWIVINFPSCTMYCTPLCELFCPDCCEGILLHLSNSPFFSILWVFFNNIFIFYCTYMYCVYFMSIMCSDRPHSIRHFLRQ